MIETPGDLVWDLPRVQQASNLEGDPLMRILPLNLHVHQKSDDDDDDDDDYDDDDDEVLSSSGAYSHCNY